MEKRLIILTAIIVSLMIVACSFSQLLPRREAGVTSTPTRTLQPTFTPTDTATPTPLPSPTPTPTSIPTDTPLPTATPLPTDTPTMTPIPTETPTPTATVPPTPRPTRKPTNTSIPKPTKTPPPPFTIDIVRGYTHCEYRGVKGYVKHANGSPYPGVAVGVWSDTWEGRVYVSEADGKFDLSLNDVPFGKFKVAVVRLETCGQRDGLPTANSCQRLSMIKEIVTTENCTGAGANQVTELKVTGP